MAIVFNSNSPTCTRCVCREECIKQVGSTLTSIHTSTDVTDYLEALQRAGAEITIQASPNTLPRQHKGKVKPKRRRVVSKLAIDIPKGASTLAQKILSLEPCIHSVLNDNINPFIGVKPIYLSAMTDLVLRGSFTKSDVTNQLKSINPNWSSSTIRSHYHTLIQAFLGLRIIEQQGTTFIFRGNYDTNY